MYICIYICVSFKWCPPFLLKFWRHGGVVTCVCVTLKMYKICISFIYYSRKHLDLDVFFVFCILERIYRVFCPIGSGWQQISAWIDGLLPSSLSFSLLTGAFFLSDASWSPAPHGAGGGSHIKLTQSIKAVHTLAGGRIPPVAFAYFLHNMQGTLVTERRCLGIFNQKLLFLSSCCYWVWQCRYL